MALQVGSYVDQSHFIDDSWATCRQRVEPPLERTVAQADVPREIVDPMAPGFPSEPCDRGSDERVEDEVSNATDKEILEQRDPLPMVVGAGDLIVKPVEFVGATKHGAEINVVPGKSSIEGPRRLNGPSGSRQVPTCF